MSDKIFVLFLVLELLSFGVESSYGNGKDPALGRLSPAFDCAPSSMDFVAFKSVANFQAADVEPDLHRFISFLT